MNKKEKKWIKENLEKIFIEDSDPECDSQADDIMFLKYSFNINSYKII